MSGTVADPNAVLFNYSEWVGRFPEFTPILEPRASMFFDLACLRLGNDTCAEFTDLAQRKTILYLMTAHIAALMGGGDTCATGGASAGGSTPVGRISRATEGSATVEFEGVAGESSSALQAWLSTTQYGAILWQMLAPLFGPQYFPGSSRLGYEWP